MAKANALMELSSFTPVLSASHQSDDSAAAAAHSRSSQDEAGQLRTGRPPHPHGAAALTSDYSNETYRGQYRRPHPLAGGLALSESQFMRATIRAAIMSGQRLPRPQPSIFIPPAITPLATKELGFRRKTFQETQRLLFTWGLTIANCRGR
ncbi:hypothetical protein VUR80DRAFT_4819 [Thermomyces stellatus]